MASEVVGPNKYGAQSSTSTKASSTTAVVPTDALSSRIAEKLKKSSMKVIQTTALEGISLTDTFTPTQLGIIGAVLKSMGYSVKANTGQIKSLLATDGSLIAIAAKSASYNDFLSNLSSEAIPSLMKRTTAKPEASRSIYKYTDEALNTLIDDIYKKKTMRPATAAEKAEHLKVIKPMLEQGTVSTTKLVTNKTTGKLESVTTQEAGPTQETVTKTIEDRIKELNPDDVDRTKRIEFQSWLSQNMAGA